MIKILYIPLDERDCNYAFPSMLAQMTQDVQVIVPPYDMMGMKKRPADVERIWAWMMEQAADCQYAVLSVDGLVYGNIINSRTHHKTKDECAILMDRFRQLKHRYPTLQIHAFNLAARVAAYNDSREDPDYWADYGYNIWRVTYLEDKLAQRQCTPQEEAEIRVLKAGIPEVYMKDFLDRRKINRFVNLASVDLVKENIFDVLTIPKDDTAEFGYAAMDQAAISRQVRALGVMDRVLVYPGADEVGSVLFARVFCLIKEYTPRIYVRYSSVLAPQIVPKYEDRPLHEGIKAQITSIGGILVEEADRGDCLLAVNGPGKHMIESGDQGTKDSTFSSHINMHELLRFVTYYAKTYHRPVGVAEVSVCNGCENEFMELMHLMGIDELVQSIGGWNTAQNTIGVVLAHTVIAAYYQSFEKYPEAKRKSQEFRLRSLMMDWFYQSNILNSFPSDCPGINPLSLGSDYEAAQRYFYHKLMYMANKNYPNGFCGCSIHIDKLEFSWDSASFLSLRPSLKD